MSKDVNLGKPSLKKKEEFSEEGKGFQAAGTAHAKAWWLARGKASEHSGRGRGQSSDRGRGRLGLECQTEKRTQEEMT